jgi:predicted ATPase
VFEGVPVRKHADATGIANAAGVSVSVAAAALAALASAGLVECLGDRWAMTTEGRRDRRARGGTRVDQLELDWW